MKMLITESSTDVIVYYELKHPDDNTLTIHGTNGIEFDLLKQDNHITLVSIRYSKEYGWTRNKIKNAKLDKFESETVKVINELLKRRFT